MNVKLQRGMISVLSANIINLLFNLLTNFLLPKYLSVDSYSAIKTFQLYGMYIGVFSFGCADGMYLRYGGKNISKIDKQELKDCLYTFRLFLVIETILFLIIAIIIHDAIIFATVLTILSLNMTGYFKNLYQASGEFRRYGTILNFTTALTFLINIILIFIAKIDNYIYYLFGYVTVDAIIWIALELYAKRILGKETKIKRGKWKLFLLDIKNGFLLMVGNFSSTLLSSLDRWFVKVMMTSLDFAQYSFVVSLEGFLNTAVTPITVTLYNFFCNTNSRDVVIKVRKYTILFASALISAAFPAKFIIEIYLDKYIASIKVLFILFGAQLFYVPIKGVYVNLYKAKGKQNLYFLKLVSVLIIGAGLNILFVSIYPFKEAFAYGTLLSAIIWMILCVVDFKEYGFSFNEIIYCLIEIIIFLIFGFTMNSIIGFLCYCLVTIIVAFILLKKEFLGLLKLCFRILKRN